MSVGAGLFYVANLEEAPFTGRRRAIFVSKEMEKGLGEASFKAILQEHKGKILPPTHKVRCCTGSNPRLPAVTVLSSANLSWWDLWYVWRQAVQLITRVGKKLAKVSGVLDPDELKFAVINADQVMNGKKRPALGSLYRVAA